MEHQEDGDMVDDHQLFEFLINDTAHDEELVQPTSDSHQQKKAQHIQSKKSRRHSS